MKNENLNSKIGEWLQNKRIEKGLSQQDVADAMNITRTAVHYWESGKRTIYADNMFDYCRVLNVNPAELVADLTRDGYL